MRSNKLQNGFTLIEVLVALLIFAIGMLGLAGLQLKTHQSSSFAHGRTNATLAVSGLVERMRSNLTGVTAGNYVYDSSADGLPASVPNCNLAAGCNAADMANNDLRQWLLELNETLPVLNRLNTDTGTPPSAIAASADVLVCRDATPETTAGSAIGCDGDPTQWTVYVEWADERDLTSQTEKRYTFTFVP